MARRIALGTAVLALALISSGPVVAAAPDDAGTQIEADLEGVPIPASTISKYYCNDFDFPAIHCFKTPGGNDAALSSELSLGLLSASDYVQIFDNVNWGGAWMVLSQDYDALWTIGWNDRISSFKGKNSATGHFYTDWFHAGSSYGFCCNQQVGSLGSFNNTFSSVYND
jgi:hypothetical protein